MPIGLPVATLIAGAVAGGAQAYGSHVSGKSNTQANRIQSDANNAALVAQREQLAYDRTQADLARQRATANDAESKREYDQTYGFNQQQADVAQSNLVNRRDYSRGQYGNYLSRLQPFAQAGTHATANLASVVGRALPASIPTAGNGAMVRLQSPTGQIQDVPAEHADYYVSKGAVKV